MKFRNKCYIFKGNHYHQTEIKANWTYARDWCRKQKGDLAIIDDQNENGTSQDVITAVPSFVKRGLGQCLHVSPKLKLLFLL